MKNQKTFRKFSLKWIVVSTVFMGLITVILVGCTSDDNNENADGTANKNKDNVTEYDGAQEIKSGESLVIELSDITETAKFYPISVDGITMEVLAVKAPDGTIRTAFNTCEICYGSGRGYYVQQGNALVCQNCGNQFKTSQVEIQSNGCNPWPIFDDSKTVTDESITISYDFLSDSTRVFSNWKVSY